MRCNARGMTIVEIVIAMGVLVVALLAIMSAMLSSDRLRQVSREQVLAYNAARDVVETMRNSTFNQIFTNFTPGGVNGGTFDVPLTVSVPPLSGVTLNQVTSGTSVGTVTFPMTGTNLDETVTDAALGMPRDLNGDGDATDTSVAGTYVLLPVRVTVRWQSQTGPVEISINTLIAEK